MMKFCKCGLPLDRNINKRYDGKYENFCNSKCADKKERQRQRKKYGIAGYYYDNYKAGDVFKWGKKVVQE